jgi:hypothetical protein
MPIRITLDPTGTPFWTEFGSGTTTDGSVWTLAGSAPMSIATHRYAPEGIAVDPSFAYWTELDANQLVSYTRSTAQAAVFGPVAYGPAGVVLDGAGNAYWTNSNDGSVDSCPVANCTAATTTSLASGRSSPWGIAVDAAYVYFTELTASGNVVRCDHSGGAQMELGGGPQSYPVRIVSDGASAYWTNQGSAPNNGSVMQCAGTVCTPIATGLANPTGIAVDSRAVYYGTLGDSTLWKVVK